MNLPELPPATLRLKLDTDALAANWRTLDAMSGKAVAGAAVKANAYGLGVESAVPVLRDAGAADFFVAHWGEVPAVLRHVSPHSVSVLHGPLCSKDVDFCRSTGVRPVINSLHQAQLWLAGGGGICDLMVDTGMNRLGVSLDQLADTAISQLQVDTLLSHLASADEDVPQNGEQLARFRAAVAQVPATRLSLSNSAGIALGSEYAFDVTRPGIALYGGVPRPEFRDHIRQVVMPQVAVLQVRKLSAGETVGYNATFTAPAAMETATVSLGYADGYLRMWSGKGMLRHNGSELPVLGRVSMDMVVVDCRAAPQLREGDWLDVAYSLPQASEVSGLSQYELLTGLGDRFARE